MEHEFGKFTIELALQDGVLELQKGYTFNQTKQSTFTVITRNYARIPLTDLILKQWSG